MKYKKNFFLTIGLAPGWVLKSICVYLFYWEVKESSLKE